MAPFFETNVNVDDAAAGRTGSAQIAVPAATDAGGGSEKRFDVGLAVAVADAIETASAEGRNPQPRCPEGYSDVERSLFRQFTESTGTSLCDSGSAYGRGWERNRRIVDLKAQPFGRIDVDHFDPRYPSATVSTFHRLSCELSCDADMNRRFARFNKKVDPGNNMSWLDVSEAFAERFDENYTYYLSYSDEDKTIGQDLQLVGFKDNGEDEDEDDYGDGNEYVLLQMHNGCDARAGFTKPVAYGVQEVGILIRELQTWTAMCGCDGGTVSANFSLQRLCGSFEGGEDGVGRWPERWSVSADGSAKCSKCGEEVSIC